MNDHAIEGRVENGGVTLHYRSFGAGRPILLLSGGPGGSCRELEPLARELARDARAILLEQRGTGRSTLPRLDDETLTIDAYVGDIEAVRRHLGLERWVLLGHSAGGLMAMAAAARHPSRAEGLILVESAGADLNFVADAPSRMRLTPEDAAVFAKWSNPDAVAAAPEQAARETYRAFVAATVHDRAYADRVMDAFAFEPHTMEIAERVLRHLQATGYDVKPALAQLRAPVLIVHGTAGYMGPAVAAELDVLFADATLTLLDACGHYPMFERPDAFLAAVRAFLARLAGPRPS